jgi:surfactin synthase thioesterase subunit
VIEVNKTTIFCFPYAGGSATMYNKWRNFADDHIEIVPVELSGRGMRFNELLYKDIHEAIDDLFDFLGTRINGSYGLFGHSMGSVIVLELAHRIKESYLPNPDYLFMSGRKPPHLEKSKKPIHALPDAAFKAEIIKKGGTLKEVFENKELSELFLPIIRNDFKLIENYEYKERSLLDSKIISIIGMDENIDYCEAKEWRNHTTQECKIFEIEGGHFFINDKIREVVGILNECIR